MATWEFLLQGEEVQLVFESEACLDVNGARRSLLKLRSNVGGTLLGEVNKLFERLCRVVLREKPVSGFLGRDLCNLCGHFVLSSIRVDLFDLAHLAHRLIVIMIKR